MDINLMNDIVVVNRYNLGVGDVKRGLLERLDLEIDIFTFHLSLYRLVAFLKCPIRESTSIAIEIVTIAHAVVET